MIKNATLFFLFFILITPSYLVAQTNNSPSGKEPIIIHKQHIAEEVVYTDIALSSMLNVYVSPVLVSNYSISQINDSNKYNNSHFHSPTISFGVDYSIIYNSFYLKTGIGFLWIKENKYNSLYETVSDTSFIDPASYIITHNKNSLQLVAANYMYLSVPVTVGKIFTLGKFKFMPEAGINLDYLIYADGYSGANLEEKLKVTRDELNTFKTRFFLANTFSFALNENWQLYLQPWYSISLVNEFNSNSTIPAYKTDLYGIRVGVIFN